MFVDQIPINGDTIANAIMSYYPNGRINLDEIRRLKLYNFVILFGIRLETCDSGIMDDAIGGIRLRESLIPSVIGTGDYWEIICSNATTEPTAHWILNASDPVPEKYGSAWVVEGQYRFYPAGDFKGEPHFRPVTDEPIQVYRWKPTKAEINNARRNNKALSSEFEGAKARGEVKIIAPTETILIHRSWGLSERNSAGCQVFADNGSLRTLYSWAQQHMNLYTKKYFIIDKAGNKLTPLVYTLLTKTQFVTANQQYTAGDAAVNIGTMFKNASIKFINIFKKH